MQKKYGAEIQLQEYGTYTLCVDALKSGAVDALTTDNAILAGYAAQEANKGKLKVVGQTFSTENYGVGLKLDDTAFCTKVWTCSRSGSAPANGRSRSTSGSARPGSSRAPATRPPRRPAGRPVAPRPDLSTTTGMPPAHLGGRHTCSDRVPAD